MPDVLVVGADRPGAISPAQRRVGARAQVAMIAVASAGWIAATDWRGLGYDAAVARASMAADLPAALAGWHPGDTLATLTRLEAAFGMAQVEQLLRGFRDLLARVLEERDDDAAAATAHRVAGIAGTLGFAHLGQLWLRVSEGEQALVGTARRAAARAIATIASRG